MVSSLIAGVFADWVGRKKMMVASALIFIASVVLIVGSHGFATLFAGRLLQGISGGVIAVVVPLYLAESLSAQYRGRGSGIFQLMLTVGIVAASAAGWYFTHQADAAIAAAGANAALILQAESHAWRSMFLVVVYPGIVFFLGTLLLGETPRWLFRRGRVDDALNALRRSGSEAEAQLQLKEMQAVQAADAPSARSGDSLLQRKFVLPFLLACIILVCNQTTGINSILSYLVVILKEAGLRADQATQGDFIVKLLNCVMTLVAIALVDRRGRKFLLIVGTSGIIVSLAACAVLFRHTEVQRHDVRAAVQSAVRSNQLDLPLAQLAGADGSTASRTLTVLYSYGGEEQLATVLGSDPDPVLRLHPASGDHALTIKSARFGSIPPPATGWLIAACLALFIASFAVGPGVVVWLTLSELMPTRIRSAGMGIALLLNQGASTLIAGMFLPVVSHYGYAAIFIFWSACTVVYFLASAFFLPETKGKTLEEIEASFAGTAPSHGLTP